MPRKPDHKSAKRVECLKHRGNRQNVPLAELGGVVRAAVKRSRALALQALLNHPLVGDLDVAEPLLDEMLEAHGLKFE